MVQYTEVAVVFLLIINQQLRIQHAICTNSHQISGFICSNSPPTKSHTVLLLICISYPRCQWGEDYTRITDGRENIHESGCMALVCNGSVWWGCMFQARGYRQEIEASWLLNFEILVRRIGHQSGSVCSHWLE